MKCAICKAKITHWHISSTGLVCDECTNKLLNAPVLTDTPPSLVTHRAWAVPARPDDLIYGVVAK